MKKIIFLSLLSVAFMQEVSLSLECPEEVIAGSLDNHLIVYLENDVPLDGGVIYLYSDPDDAITVTNSEWVADQFMFNPGLVYPEVGFGSWFWGGGIGAVYEPDSSPIFDFTFTASSIAQQVTIGTVEGIMNAFSESYEDLEVGCTFEIIDPNEPDVYLHFGEYSQEQGFLEIWIDTSVFINGLQFDVTGLQLTDAILGDDSGGFFVLSFNPDGLILLFGMEDGLLTHDHLFCTLHFDDVLESQICFENIHFYNSLGGEYENYDFEDCIDSELCDLLGDLNEDSILDVLDVILSVDCILEYENCPCADFDGNGIVDILDVVITVDLILGE